MIHRTPVLILTGLSLSSCASQLVVSNAPSTANSEIAGIPVARPMTVIEQSFLTEHSSESSCKRVSSERFVSIAGPETYYVSLDAAQFGGSEFELKLNENGTLASVSINSEPAPTEAASALGTLASEVLPALGIGRASIAATVDGSGETRNSALKPCDKGKRIVCLKSLDGNVIAGSCLP